MNEKNNPKKSSDDKQLKETTILQDQSKMNSLYGNKEKQSYPETHDEIIKEKTVSNLGVRNPVEVSLIPCNLTTFDNRINIHNVKKLNDDSFITIIKDPKKVFKFFYSNFVFLFS